MASTFDNDLQLEEMATGENAGSWGTKTNTNLELIADAFGYGTATIGDADTSLTMPEGSDTAANKNVLRSLFLKITSSASLTTTRVVTLLPNTVNKVWLIENATSGSQTITIKQGSGATINILNGQTKIIATDGAGAGAAVTDLSQDLAITDLFIDDDLSLQSDGAIINFGADDDITLTHTADTSLTLGGAGSTTGLIVNNTATDGDPFLAFALSGTQKFTMGVDDGDSDKFKIGTTAIGTDTSFSIDSSGNVEIPTGGLTITTDDNTAQLTLVSTDADASSGPQLDLHRNSASPADADYAGVISFKSENSADETISYGNINLQLGDVTDGTEDGTLSIQTIVGGTVRDRVNFRSSGVVFNEEGQDIDFRVESDGNTNMLAIDAANDAMGIGMVPDTSVRLSVSGQIGPTNGDASAPTHTFYSDPNTGMFRPASNKIAFSTDGTERIRIEDTGAVIRFGGTTNAGYVDFNGSTLQLTTQRNPESGSFTNTGRAHTAIDLFDGNGTASNCFIRFKTATSNNATASTRMHISSGGLVGIGKVPSTSTGSMLQIEGADGLAMRRSGQTNHFTLRPLSSSDGDGMRFTQEGSGDRMVIDAAGRVGIGTTPEFSAVFQALELGPTSLVSANNTNGRMVTNVYYDGSYKRKTDGVSLQYEQDNAGHLWYFDASGTADVAFTQSEVARLNSSGHFVLSGGGNVVLNNGSGIDFSATGDSSGTTSSELFDDYEEGTWTPYLARWSGGAISATYTEQTGRYTKVGRLVTVSFSVITSAISSQGTSIAYIAGLPYNNDASHNYLYAGTFGSRTAISDSTVATSIIKHSTNNSLLFRQNNDFDENVDDDWLVGTMRGSITYEHG